jgi:dTDP-4-amino-4,6-dideoxygalactose transaminase
VLANRYQTPKIPEGYLSSWAQYTLVDSNRDAIMADYKGKGITSMIYYDTCMHQQTAFRVLGHSDADFPIASRLAKSVFSLPMHGYLDVTKISQL